MLVFEGESHDDPVISNYLWYLNGILPLQKILLLRLVLWLGMGGSVPETARNSEEG